MFGLFSGLDSRRRRLLRDAPPGPLHDYLAAGFPDFDADFRTVEFVSLDLETTGLDHKRDEILSVGLVALTARRITLDTAELYSVKPARSVPESSVAIHMITDDQAARGRSIRDVLPLILARLSGRVLLAHHAKIETEFLDAACIRVFGTSLVVPVADTEALSRRWLQQRNLPFAERDLRLHALRERYGLPRYKAHNAMSDALATAELFCAFVAKRNLGANVPLKEFLVRR